MNIDYTKYSLNELYDVRENIDKSKFSERYKTLELEIKLREDSPKGKNEGNSLSKKDKSLIALILLGVASVFSVWIINSAIVDGSIKGRHGNEYFLATQPELFYFYIGLYLFIIFGFIYTLIKRRYRTGST
jgi:hypothetical protein